jgi:predicted regulator of Ras-like GTPase activity (Roadblock/LC7/MglB family)
MTTMDGPERSGEQAHETADPAAPLPSRAHMLKMTLADLTKPRGVHGGLIVTADGFVITSALPPGYAIEALGALGATLGRELELGAERLGRGLFKAAHFASSDGAIFVAGSPVGFLILIADPHVDVPPVLQSVGRAQHRLLTRS